MNKTPLKAVGHPHSTRSPTPGARLKIIRDLSAACSLAQGRGKYPTKIQDIAGALIAEGYRSLDEQAKALGVHRSTAWTIMKTKHKLDRLSQKTTNNMLANPALPPSVSRKPPPAPGVPLSRHRALHVSFPPVSRRWRRLPVPGSRGSGCCFRDSGSASR